jgi:hypothetical protein
MRFGIVNPFIQRARLLDCKNEVWAVRASGIKGEVDHGMVHRGLAIIVYEYSLFTPIDVQAYFAIGHKLYAGHAVLYAVNENGETIDLPMTPPIKFLPNASDVERAIASGIIERPTISINGAVLWQWPQDKPKGMFE